MCSKKCEKGYPNALTRRIYKHNIKSSNWGY